ncbi:MAG: DNA polymerase IV [Candidatus Krumholzibacteriota bacterium]|nr:DNA polymerase IV [Candidatus Krumholzibacteriota bacterium]
MDAFYASVEELDDPSLKGKPVIVGGPKDARGVVSAASYEAREFGVHSAMSAYRARKLCPHGIVIAPRMSRYAELSREIRAIFAHYTPLIEPISLDEAFLDVTASRKLFGPPVEIARMIKRRIRDEVGLVASVGVASNKYLAKLASDLEKPDGFVVIDQENAAARLAPLPVGRLWGVGKVSQKSLEQFGIRTVGDISRMPLDQLEKHLGSNARRLKELSLGIDDRPVVTGGEARSISAENTFARDIDDRETLRNHLDRLVERVAQRTRRSGFEAYTIQLKARYADFTTVTRAATLAEPTAQTPAIRDAARELLEVRLGRKGRALRLLGVGVYNLVRVGETQPLLIEDDRSRKNRSIDTVMDSLQDRFGSDVIHRGRGRRKEKDTSE